MQQLIEAIVKPLVDYPEDVRIETDENTNRIVYKLFVHPEDRGWKVWHGTVSIGAIMTRRVLFPAGEMMHQNIARSVRRCLEHAFI